jgi:hypothetical protein
MSKHSGSSLYTSVLGKRETPFENGMRYALKNVIVYVRIIQKQVHVHPGKRETSWDSIGITIEEEINGEDADGWVFRSL